MKIGVFYSIFYSAIENREIESVADGVKKLSSLGAFYYEVDANRIANQKEETELLQILESNGAKVNNLYFKMPFSLKDSDKAIKFTESKIEQCKRLKCHQIMPVLIMDSNESNSDEALQTIANYYKAVAEIAEKNDIKAVFENASTSICSCFSPKDISAVLGNSNKIGYVLDTGNHWFAKNDVLSMVDQYKNRIKSVHLKDILPECNQQSDIKVHFPVLGNGISPLKETIKKLEKGDSNMVFTIETERSTKVFEDISQSIKFIKSMEDEILMRIEIINADMQLFDYAKLYEEYGDLIELKTMHMFAVASLMDTLAKEMGLNFRQKKLAHLIGLFHDIGRYEQIKIYNTFRDSDSIDHANLSEEITKNSTLIETLSEKDQFIILKAIKNHNKYAIEEGLDEETLLMCKMIRDADKIDIFRVVCTESFENSYGVTKDEIENSLISIAVYNSIMNHKLVDIKDRKQPIDFILGCMAFVFDINFPASYKIIKQKQHYFCKLNTLTIKNTDTKEKLADIFNEIENFISSKQSN